MFNKRSMLTVIAFLTNLETSRSLMFGGKGGFGGFGGGFGGFRMSPPGPVFLPAINASTRWGDILEDVVLTALDHCKSVRLCNTTDRFTHYDSECSECHPCTCDDTCYTRGDCCVDKLLDDLKDELVMSSPGVAEARVMGCHSTYISPSDYNYTFMIDTCSDGFHDSAIVERCEKASSNDTQARWPVWSRASGHVYRNADCAVCHQEDVGQLVQWDLRIQCHRSVHLQDTGSAQAVIDQVSRDPSCEVLFTPPAGCQPFACRPRQDRYIDACNATGRRPDYDAGLWKACEVLHGEVTLGTDTYKNVFCAMCNEEQLETVGQCQDELTFPFFVVLNVSSFQSSLSSSSLSEMGSDDDGDFLAEESCSCRDDEIYDKYEMKCRELHCSMTRTLHNRHCHPLVSDSTGLAYEVAISLTPIAPNTTVRLQEISSLKQVARNIRTAFLLQGSTDSGWDVQLQHFRVIAQAQTGDDATATNESELSVTRFKAHIKFASTWPETAAELESRLFALTNSLWNVSVDGRPKQSFKAAGLYIASDPENETRLFSSVGLYASGANTVEYAIDIPDQLIQGYTTDALEVDSYLPVSQVLKCARVSFNISNDTEAENPPLKINKTSGAAYHVASNRVIGFEFVQVEDEEVAFVCADQLFAPLEVAVTTAVAPENTFSTHLRAVAGVCQTVTGVVLVLVLLTFCLFPELRTIGGKNTMGLVATLLFAIMLLEVGMYSKKLGSLCVLLGLSTHFFLLSTFTWALLCTFHAFRQARHVFGASNPEDRDTRSRLYTKHLALSVAVPSTVIVATLLGNYLGNPNNCYLDLGYGRGLCFLSNRWSLGFSAIFPVCLVLLLALLLYVIAARGNPTDVTLERKKSSQRHFRHFAVHVAITGLMGLTWLSGIFAVLLDVEILRYGFLTLCPLLAVCLSMAFVCNKRVLGLYQARFFSRCLKEKRYDKHSQRFEPIDT